MKIGDTLSLAFKNVVRSGVKSLLCALAVCVGISSVCTILILGGGAGEAVGEEIDKTGLGGITFYQQGANAYFLSSDDIDDTKQLSGVASAMPLAFKSGQIKVKNTRSSTMVMGVDHSLGDILSVELLYGSLIEHGDISSNKRSIVVDAQLAQSAYGRQNIVGKEVSLIIDGISEQFTVCGVVQSQKSGLESLVGGNIPSIAYIPYTTLNDVVGGNSVDMLAISCMANVDQDQVAQEVVKSLNIKTGQSFEYENLSGITDGLKSIMTIVTLFISGTASISILVGGIGVMNSMVASVDARTREIGVYMALGAKKGDIVRCFLFEALIICLVGGVVGVAVSGVAFAAISAVFTIIDLSFNAEILIYGVLGAGLCGVVFGISPALKAAKLNPIDAIRD